FNMPDLGLMRGKWVGMLWQSVQSVTYFCSSAIHEDAEPDEVAESGVFAETANCGGSVIAMQVITAEILIGIRRMGMTKIEVRLLPTEMSMLQPREDLGFAFGRIQVLPPGKSSIESVAS
ncbi:hypothetical protein Ancab_001314, partial [Ancistrocladus abbreviatus]